MARMNVLLIEDVPTSAMLGILWRLLAVMGGTI